MIEIEIVEVGPRDGLQNESTVISPVERADMIGRLVEAGLRRLEVVSFVNAERVPQMAGAEAVMAALPRVDGVSYAGLVLNRQGLDRAIATGVDEVNVVVVCSDTFGRRNQRMDRREMANLATELVATAREHGLRTTVTLAAAFGCPFEGEVAPESVLEAAQTVLQAAPDEIALADTIGCGVPSQVRILVSGLRALSSEVKLRGHFHNTRNSGYANALAAIDAGVIAIDSSIGGLGGCPFAPRATGNIATEDLVWQLERGRHSTGGVSVAKLLEVHEWAASTLGLSMPGLLAPAGVFPAA